jgi:hypothetical protein
MLVGLVPETDDGVRAIEPPDRLEECQRVPMLKRAM